MAALGIGGVFFRAVDPASVQAWYLPYFGSALGETPWQQAAGPTMFMPFPADTDYFPADRQWMINFRVDDLDDLLSRFATDGVAVTTDPSWNTPETGRFARVYDPEGNPVEIWEPPAD